MSADAAQELKTALEEKTTKPPDNNWWCVSGGVGSLAGGFLSVAVGDGAQALGEMSLASAEKLTLPQLSPDQLRYFVLELLKIKFLHLQLNNTGHVKQIDRLLEAMLAQASQAYRDGQKAAQSQSPEKPQPASPSGTAPPVEPPHDASAQKKPESPDACGSIPFQQSRSRKQRNKSRPQASQTK